MEKGIAFTDIFMDNETVRAVTEVLQTTRYVKGPRVEAFEREFAEESGTDHAIAVSSGTAALLLGVQAADIGPGDEVFVPGHSFFATVSPVLFLGATPRFVDIDPATYTMDPAELELAIQRANKPAAVVPVHIYGQMADMESLREIAADHDLSLLEDACQAHFGVRDGIRVGEDGDAAAFSFYPSKNMTVGGDGGMLVTDDDDLAVTARALRDHGRDEDGVHRYLGLNFRMDETNAAVGLAQLEHIREWNQARRDAARRYNSRLAEVDAVTTPAEADDVHHCYHLYVIQSPDRDGLQAALENNGIETGIHYETPLHEHPAVLDRCDPPTLPTTERLYDRILSLPMHPRITDEEIDTVCHAIAEYHG
jgi:dTDP-4-amino-4,6-dideoxygalactose transaminase